MDDLALGSGKMDVGNALDEGRQETSFFVASRWKICCEGDEGYLRVCNMRMGVLVRTRT
jgi:hypothetical protein